MINLKTLFGCENTKPIEPTQTLSESIKKAAELIGEYEELKKHRTSMEKSDRNIRLEYFDSDYYHSSCGDYRRIYIKKPLSLKVIDFLIENHKSQLKDIGVEVW